MSKHKVYLVFGAQGSGKSTQAKLLSEKLNIPFFDAGNELRTFAHSGTEEAEIVKEKMAKGQLVSNSTLRQLMESFIAKHAVEGSIVVDGFPRNVVQLELLEEMVAELGWDIVAIFVELDDETAKKRLADRFQMIDGQKVRRQDDQPAIVEKRLAVFRRETLPVIDEIEEKFTLIKADGLPSIDQIHQEILEKIYVVK